MVVEEECKIVYVKSFLSYKIAWANAGTIGIDSIALRPRRNIGIAIKCRRRVYKTKSLSVHVGEQQKDELVDLLSNEVGVVIYMEWSI